MANSLYPSYKQLLLGSGINLTTATIKVALVDTGVVAYSSAHANFSDISAGVIGAPVALGSKTIAAGVFDAADVSFTGLSAAPTIEALAIYMDSGTASTSSLIAWIDDASGSLPVAAGATQVDVAWHASGIFAL